MVKKRIALVSNHAGFILKETIIRYLIKEKYDVKDFGCYSGDSVDYPDYAHPMAQEVASGNFEIGISICGTGNGINMVINKYPGIKGGLCWNEEISMLARAHNDANICAMPGRFLSETEALLIVNTFLKTSFEGVRHLRRIRKIPVDLP